MKKSYWIWIWLLFLLPSLLLAKVGFVDAIEGEVDLVREGKRLLLHQKDPINKGDLIITHSASRAKLIFNDHSVVTLGGNSHFRIDEYLEQKEPKVNFSMLRGIFRILTGKVGKIAPKNFHLKTKNATIGIRGTEIFVQTQPSKDTIACLQGAIEVTSLATAKSVVVAHGYFTDVARGHSPTKPMPLRDHLKLIEKIDKQRRHHQGFERLASIQRRDQALAARMKQNREGVASASEMLKQAAISKQLQRSSKAASSSQGSHDTEPHFPMQTPMVTQEKIKRPASDPANNEDQASDYDEIDAIQEPLSIHHIAIAGEKMAVEDNQAFGEVTLDLAGPNGAIDRFFEYGLEVDRLQSDELLEPFVFEVVVEKGDQSLVFSLQHSYLRVTQEDGIEIVFDQKSNLVITNNNIHSFQMLPSGASWVIDLSKAHYPLAQQTLAINFYQLALDASMEDKELSEKVDRHFREIYNFFLDGGTYRVRIGLSMTNSSWGETVEGSMALTAVPSRKYLDYAGLHLWMGHVKRGDTLSGLYLGGDPLEEEALVHLIDTRAHALYNGRVLAVQKDNLSQFGVQDTLYRGIFSMMIDFGLQKFLGFFQYANANENLFFQASGEVGKEGIVSQTLTSSDSKHMEGSLRGRFYGEQKPEVGGEFLVETEDHRLFDGRFAGSAFLYTPIMEDASLPIATIENLVKQNYTASFKGEVWAQALDDPYIKGEANFILTFADKKIEAHLQIPYKGEQIHYVETGSIWFQPTADRNRQVVRFESHRMATSGPSGTSKMVSGLIAGGSKDQKLAAIDGIFLLKSNKGEISGVFEAERTVDEVVFEKEYLTLGYWMDADLSPQLVFKGEETSVEDIQYLIEEHVRAQYKGKAFAYDQRFNHFKGDFTLEFYFADQKFDGSLDLDHEKDRLRFRVEGSIKDGSNLFISDKITKQSSGTVPVEQGVLRGEFYGEKAKGIGGAFEIKSSSQYGLIKGGFAGEKQAPPPPVSSGGSNGGSNGGYPGGGGYSDVISQ